MSILLRPPFAPGPPRPSRILEPSGLHAPRGSERYRVEGAGAILIEARAGDRLRIVNDEGGQPCEIIAAHPGGRIDPGLLGQSGGVQAAGLQSLLTSGEASLAKLRQRIARAGLDLATPGALRLFGSETPARAEETLTLTGPATLIIAAPGSVMAPDAQDTATPLTVHLTLATPRTQARFDLPDPLADPILDLRVRSATAEAYVVKAGDYLQIIDVDGRQCTDFQCFSARKLDKGLEHALDVTSTRSAMGHVYPMPGLHSKYYDQDFTPLIEVIQDTCGRHDTFGLACTAKYYDDIGYPGHANCTENFNHALGQYGIAARGGWMAANFYFNTGIDSHGVMYADEPWSRPGDYVLVRALTDLVCVSSACPDDTTPANGWNPTDIHVRTYSGAENFKRATAHRPTKDCPPKMTKETGFHDRLAGLTRNFTEYRGYWLANSYPANGPIDEYWACRQKSVLLDLSALRKWEITGPDAETLMQWCLTRDMKKLAVGQILYSAMCYPHGGMIDDGTVFRLGQDNFRWVGGDDYSGIWLREEAERLGLKCLVRSSTDQLHNLAIQGPESRALLAKVIWTPAHQPTIAELPWFRFTIGRIGAADGVPVVVSRTGYTGELGYEVWCHPRHAGQVFDAIWAAGPDHGLTPMGLQALDMLRIEAGLIFAGYDFTDQTDPYEAGIGFTVPLKSKTDDFVGRAALQRRKDHPARKFVGLVIEGNVQVGHGDPIHIGRAQVGEVTSATRSPILGQNIALARIDIAHADTGTGVEVGKLDGHQKRLPARIVSLSHYDPGKTRPQS